MATMAKKNDSVLPERLSQALQESNMFQTLNLTGKTVAFIALGCDPAKQEMYRYLIQESGMNAVIVENPDNMLAQTICHSSETAHMIPTDLTNRPSLVTDVIASLDRWLLDNNTHKYDGIMTYWDDAVGLTARVAQHYQLPSNSVQSIDLAHDKSLARQTLMDLGYPSPFMAVCKSKKQLDDEFIQQFKFPVILKPVYGAASIGVMKADTHGKLRTMYLEVLEILKECYAHDDLMGLVFDQEESTNQLSTDDELDSKYHVVVEEFLTGREYDCDCIVRDGEVIWSELCDDWDYVSPHFVELGSNTPTTSPPDRELAIKAYARRVVTSLGLTTGVHHIEIIDDQHLGPVLVECNPRMGGGPVRMNHIVSHRVDLAIAALHLAVDLTPILKPKEETEWRMYSCATACLFAEKSGTLKRDSQEILDEVVEGIREETSVVISSLPAGSELVGWGTPNSHPSSLGLLSISVEGSVQEAKDQVNRYRELFLAKVNESLS